MQICAGNMLLRDLILLCLEIMGGKSCPWGNAWYWRWNKNSQDLLSDISKASLRHSVATKTRPFNCKTGIWRIVDRRHMLICLFIGYFMSIARAQASGTNPNWSCLPSASLTITRDPFCSCICLIPSVVIKMLCTASRWRCVPTSTQGGHSSRVHSIFSPMNWLFRCIKLCTRTVC